jgi:hypothetical protein
MAFSILHYRSELSSIGYSSDIIEGRNLCMMRAIMAPPTPMPSIKIAICSAPCQEAKNEPGLWACARHMRRNKTQNPGGKFPKLMDEPAESGILLFRARGTVRRCPCSRTSFSTLWLGSCLVWPCSACYYAEIRSIKNRLPTSLTIERWSMVSGIRRRAPMLDGISACSRVTVKEIVSYRLRSTNHVSAHLVGFLR